MSGATSAYAGFYAGPLLSFESLSVNGASYQGFMPRLMLGYGGFVREAFFLGAEMEAGTTSIPINNHPNSYAGLKTSYSYGISLVPGLALDEYLMGYVRLGVLFSHFSSANLNATHSGFQRGLGLETKFAENWSVRGEVDYVSYASFANVGSPAAFQYVLGLNY